jgi:predicted RNA binding protein YcfA (HicA-like mRNA interferase family)
VTDAELNRKLRAQGCVLKRQGKGSHEIWHNPMVNCSAVIPNHPGDIPTGTLRAILEQLAVTRDQLDSV